MMLHNAIDIFFSYTQFPVQYSCLVMTMLMVLFLTDWLTDWFIYLLIGRLTGWLSSCLSIWLTGWLVGWLAGRVADWLTGRSVDVGSLKYCIYLVVSVAGEMWGVCVLPSSPPTPFLSPSYVMYFFLCPVTFLPSFLLFSPFSSISLQLLSLFFLSHLICTFPIQSMSSVIPYSSSPLFSTLFS